MSEFWKSVLTAFGKAAKDASPEELDEMVQTTATALDAEPAKAPDAEPAESTPDEEVKDEETIEAPKGDDIGSKLDRIITMLEAKSRGGEGAHRLHDETDLDEMIAKLSGEGEKSAITIPVENDCASGPHAMRLLNC